MISSCCDQEVYENGVSVGLFEMTPHEAEQFCSDKTKETGRKHDWHFVAGRVHVKALPESTRSPACYPAPEADSQWKHKSSRRRYRVLAVANENATSDKWPVTVVYRDIHDQIWSRPLSEWVDRFEPV